MAATDIYLVFPKEFGANTGVTVSNKYQIQLKKYLLTQKSRSSHRRCSVKEGLQRPAQVFSCKYCKIFKNTYFEKYLGTTGSENQDLSDKYNEGRYFLLNGHILVDSSLIRRRNSTWKVRRNDIDFEG